jgi:hypothetical protein
MMRSGVEFKITTLTGQSTYDQWKADVLMFANIRNLRGHLDGTATEPERPTLASIKLRNQTRRATPSVSTMDGLCVGVDSIWIGGPQGTDSPQGDHDMGLDEKGEERPAPKSEALSKYDIQFELQLWKDEMQRWRQEQ